jgi:hypothetical protein
LFGLLQVPEQASNLTSSSIPFQRQQDQVFKTTTMTDNYIVKTVAGTCVGFSFILVGKAIQKAVHGSSLTWKAMQSPSHS